MRETVGRSPVPSAGYRPLVAPGLLTGASFLAYAWAPQLADRLAFPAETLRDLSGVCAWLALAWLGGRVCDGLLRRAARLSGRTAPYPRLLADLLHVALFAAAVVAILLSVFQRDAAGLIATSSVVIAVVGFALRGIIADLFAGIALGLEHPYRIGDWIETSQAGAGAGAGQVVEINWRATRLRARNGTTLVVPNGLIAGQRLVIYGNGETGYRVTLPVPLDPVVPVRRAERILLAGALDAARDIAGLAPDVMFHEIIDGVAVWHVRFIVPDHGQEMACRSAVGRGVLRALRRAGLGIARPRRDLTLARTGAPGTGNAEAERRAALLRQIDLFRPFDAAERAELAEHMEERLLARGDVVVHAGAQGDSLYILAEGALGVEKDGITIDHLIPGDVFGEMSLLTGQPRSATVAAATEAVIYEVGRPHLQPILERRPEIAEGLAAVMAARQAMNAERRRLADLPPVLPPTREDLLARLRGFFHLR
jgi:small-conductance mechanosensitive channel/CRP-like cAMP-binding protein